MLVAESRWIGYVSVIQSRSINVFSSFCDLHIHSIGMDTIVGIDKNQALKRAALQQN